MSTQPPIGETGAGSLDEPDLHGKTSLSGSKAAAGHGARALSDRLESADRSEFAQNKKFWSVLRSNLISKRSSASFRARLTGLFLALTIPSLTLAAGGLYSAYQAEQRATEQLLIGTTRALALNVDRDLAQAEATLKTLAVSQSLAIRDLGAFHRQLNGAMPLPGGRIILFDTAGDALLSSSHSFGTQLPPAARKEERKHIAQTRGAKISNLYRGSVSGGQPVVSLDLPVHLNSRPHYVLSAVLPAEAFSDLFVEQRLDDNQWTGSIVDSNGHIVASSRDTDIIIGSQVSAALLHAMTQAREGAVSTVTFDHKPVRAYFSRSPQYGLSFVVGYPAPQLSGSLKRSLAWFLALAAAVGLGLAYAIYLSRSLLAPVARMTTAARMLGRGERAVIEPTGISDFDDVQKALSETAAELHLRNVERDEAEALLRTSEQRLRLALEAGELGTWSLTPATGDFTCSERTRAILGEPAGEDIGVETLKGIGHPDELERFDQAVRRATAERKPFSIETRILRRDGSVHWVDVRALAMSSPDKPDNITLTGVIQEITERKTFQNRQQMLMGELNHRVKNSLATVQSIAMLTRRSVEGAAGGSEEQWDAFEQRLVGLARTHDLLTAEDWNGSTLSNVLSSELDPYQDPTRPRAVLKGEPIRLNARATLTIGLCVHELATNAAKYGALRVPNGSVSVSWHVEPACCDSTLVITWQESGGPPVFAPERQGFGSKLLERGLRRELAGTIMLDFATEGLRCEIRLPLRKITPDAAEDALPAE